jgi:hypothetical protein
MKYNDNIIKKYRFFIIHIYNDSRQKHYTCTYEDVLKQLKSCLKFNKPLPIKLKLLFSNLNLLDYMSLKMFKEYLKYKLTSKQMEILLKRNKNLIELFI